MSAISTGVVFIHSAPRALCSHVEWAISREIGAPVRFDWLTQPALPGAHRTEYIWHGPAGSGAAIASALHGWEQLRFEVTEDATEHSDGGRWCHTPALGIFHSPVDHVGNMVVTENRLRAILDFAGDDADLMREGLQCSLGEAWDAELEVFRQANEVAPVRWLHSAS